METVIYIYIYNYLNHSISDCIRWAFVSFSLRAKFLNTAYDVVQFIDKSIVTLCTFGTALPGMAPPGSDSRAPWPRPEENL